MDDLPQIGDSRPDMSSNNEVDGSSTDAPATTSTMNPFSEADRLPMTSTLLVEPSSAATSLQEVSTLTTSALEFASASTSAAEPTTDSTSASDAPTATTSSEQSDVVTADSQLEMHSFTQANPTTEETVCAVRVCV